jgi:hypothetical protein
MTASPSPSPDPKPEDRTYNYRVTADTAGPYVKGDVVTPADIEKTGATVADWWDKGLIIVTGEAPAVAPPRTSEPTPAGEGS